jgi:hypothetical protein
MMPERAPDRRPRDWSWLIVLLAFGAPLLNQLNGWIGTGVSLPPMVFPLLVAVAVVVAAAVLIWRAFRDEGTPTVGPPPIAPAPWRPDALQPRGLPPATRWTERSDVTLPPVSRLEPVVNLWVAVLAIVGLAGLVALALVLF